jgi:hypothetical protein
LFEETEVPMSEVVVVVVVDETEEENASPLSAVAVVETESPLSEFAPSVTFLA